MAKAIRAIRREDRQLVSDFPTDRENRSGTAAPASVCVFPSVFSELLPAVLRRGP